MIDKTVGVDVNVCNGGITNEGVTISPNEKVTVAVTKDGKQYGYSAGEAITEEGFYTATITDAYGNSKTISFLIVSPEAKTSIDYELGQELKEYGSYEVVVTDKLGNSRTYSFTLKFQMNAWAITLIVLGLATAVGVAATIVMKRKRLFKK